MMEKYNSWEEYFASNQDNYLNEDCCDCYDVMFRCGEFTVYGKTSIFAFEICRDYQTVCIIANANVYDLIHTLLDLGSGLDKLEPTEFGEYEVEAIVDDVYWW